MKELVKISCYIEEYSNQNGKLCARLRDKASNKKVVLMGHNTDKNHLLRFLTQAKIAKPAEPVNGQDERRILCAAVDSPVCLC